MHGVGRFLAANGGSLSQAGDKARLSWRSLYGAEMRAAVVRSFAARATSCCARGHALAYVCDLSLNGHLIRRSSRYSLDARRGRDAERVMNYLHARVFDAEEGAQSSRSPIAHGLADVLWRSLSPTQLCLGLADTARRTGVIAPTKIHAAFDRHEQRRSVPHGVPVAVRVRSCLRDAPVRH